MKTEISVEPAMSISTESPAEVTIRDGHRELLTTFREFARSLDGTEVGAPDPHSLRAVIAFLRQGLLPFAHWEQMHLEGCAEVAEDTAFEHAFLNAEVDALAAAAEELGGDEERNQTGITPGIRRCLYRIEAVLELHVQKAEDRESLFSLPSVETGGRAQGDGGALGEMDAGEIHRFILRHEWGLLCTVGHGIPYAVPVSYGFEGRHLYVASGPGRKRQNLDACPAVCLTIAEVEDGDRWRSVVITGEAHPVREVRGKLHALNALRRQRSTGAPPSATDLARVASSTIFRIVPDEITGRMRG